MRVQVEKLLERMTGLLLSFSVRAARQVRQNNRLIDRQLNLSHACQILIRLMERSIFSGKPGRQLAIEEE